MKKFLPSLCLVIAVTSSGLFAQAASDMVPETSPARHVGPSDPTNYFTAGYDQTPPLIGSEENPVTADEYCAFLNAKAEDDWSFFSSSYYEPSFMSTDRDWTRSPNATIQRTGYARVNKYHLGRNVFGGKGFIYTVLPGHRADIIDAVSSTTVQKEFRHWRKNPTVQELGEYLNDIANYRINVKTEEQQAVQERLDAADAIESSYPETAAEAFTQADAIENQVYNKGFSKISIKGLTYQVEASSDGHWIIYDIHVKKSAVWERPSAVKNGQFQ